MSSTDRETEPAATELAPSPALRRYESVRDLISSPDNPTPLVRVRRVVGGGDMELFLKLEWFNPFGSIKDRTARYLLEGMERRGELEGKELIEPTSGNTGTALAALAALMGKKLTVTVPRAVPEEQLILLRMLGAEVWPAADDLCPIDHPRDGAIALARSMLSSEGGEERYAMPNQYENPDNVRAHYETTGPEIWKQTEGLIRYFFAAFGTCGTISGAAKYLKERERSIRVIAVEPQKGHRIPGMKNLGESRTPAILDMSVIDEVIEVRDEPAYAMTKRLFREEGLIVGPSTGAIVEAAARYGAREGARSRGVAVAISPDGGCKYASYFADLIGDEGRPVG